MCYMVIALKLIVKKDWLPNGIDTISAMKKELSIPVYAIGGITPDKVELLKKIGADGMAVMSGIFSANHPGEAALQFLKKCEGEISEKSL